MHHGSNKHCICQPGQTTVRVAETTWIIIMKADLNIYQATTAPSSHALTHCHTLLCMFLLLQWLPQWPSGLCDTLHSHSSTLCHTVYGLLMPWSSAWAATMTSSTPDDHQAGQELSAATAASTAAAVAEASGNIVSQGLVHINKAAFPHPQLATNFGASGFQPRQTSSTRADVATGLRTSSCPWMPTMPESGLMSTLLHLSNLAHWQLSIACAAARPIYVYSKLSQLLQDFSKVSLSESALTRMILSGANCPGYMVWLVETSDLVW